jgi:hypothetical protein
MAFDNSVIDMGLLIPPSMKNQFWLDFCDAWSEELELYKSEKILPLKNYYYIDDRSDVNSLVDIGVTFGNEPDRSIDSSIEFLKKWDKLIYYKIKYKSSYISYDYIFNSIKFTGDVYNLYWNDGVFQRGVDVTKILAKLNTLNSYLKFDIGVSVAGTDDTGLNNDTTIYTLYITENHNINEILIEGQNAQTFTDLFSEINSQLTDVTLNFTSPSQYFYFEADNTEEVVLGYYEPEYNGLLSSIDPNSLGLHNITLDSEQVGINYSNPFIYFYPIFFFNASYFLIDSLDSGGFLDTGLTLDDIFFSSPTSHLSISFSINRLINWTDGIDYMVNSTYLDFLLNGVNYNRQASEVPHIGFQLNLLNDLSGYMNNLSDDRLYSIPDLKLQATTTKHANTYIVDDVYLDTFRAGSTTDYEMTLDDSSPYRLDQGIFDLVDLTDLEKTFYKIRFGNGGVGTVSKDYPHINDEIMIYVPCDYDSGGGSLIDYSSNLYTFQLYGDYSFVDTNIDKGIFFNGLDTRIFASNIQIAYTNLSFNFWINKNRLLVTDDYTLMNIKDIATSSDFIDIYYEEGTGIKVDVNDGASTFSLVSSDVLTKQEYYMITLVLDLDTTQIMTLYINGVEEDTVDISTIANYQDAYEMSIGAKDIAGYTQFWEGTIDEVRVYNKVLSTGEILYIYDALLGNYYKRWNMLYETTRINIRYSDTDWIIISTMFYFDWLTSDLDEIVEINECGIENESGDLILYSSFPTCEFRKRNHIEVNWLIKLT